jgi:hypothetical protein
LASWPSAGRVLQCDDGRTAAGPAGRDRRRSAAQPAGGSGLARTEPGAFGFQRYASEAQARPAIENREVYGAFVVTTHRITVLEASAASPAVAQLLSTVGQHLASHTAARATAARHRYFAGKDDVIIALMRKRDRHPVHPEDPPIPLGAGLHVRQGRREIA